MYRAHSAADLRRVLTQSVIFSAKARATIPWPHIVVSESVFASATWLVLPMNPREYSTACGSIPASRLQRAASSTSEEMSMDSPRSAVLTSFRHSYSASELSKTALAVVGVVSPSIPLPQNRSRGGASGQVG